MKKKGGGGSLGLGIVALMPGEYAPQSANYENDDDGFKESDGALRVGEGTGLRAPGSEEYLQANCPRHHKPRARARRCELCFADIPAKD